MAEKVKNNKLLKKGKGIFAEFKAFISRGNILDLAVGVIIGGAFGAIVTAFVNMLMSVCTWNLPGGISGLITILPSTNPSQIPPLGLQVSYTIEEFVSIEEASVRALYTLHGGTYIYNGCSIIDWGSLINAVISFIIIAIVLFVIVKTANFIHKKREEAKARALERYYQQHPEERPVPVEPEHVVTDVELLTEIRDLLVQQKENK